MQADEFGVDGENRTCVRQNRGRTLQLTVQSVTHRGSLRIVLLHLPLPFITATQAANPLYLHQRTLGFVVMASAENPGDASASNKFISTTLCDNCEARDAVVRCSTHNMALCFACDMDLHRSGMIHMHVHTELDGSPVRVLAVEL